MILMPKAKINLGLYILRRRPDGYHDVATVMVPIGWSDVLEVVPSATGVTTLTVSGRAVDCPTEKNLVIKAYRALKAVVADLPPADIYLHKIVPDGAGLGGGSADAAATILGLNEVFNLGLSIERMQTVAATVGADCPFFIRCESALATGTGTTLAEAAVPGIEGMAITVAKAKTESVPTAQAYAGVTPCDRPTDGLLADLARHPGLWSASNVCNDFEPHIMQLRPEIRRVKDAMTAGGACYGAMSGSGAAVFGLFDDMAAATAVADTLSAWCDTWCGTL